MSQNKTPVVMLRDYFDVANNIGIKAVPGKVILVDENIAKCMIADGYADYYGDDNAPDSCPVTRLGAKGEQGPPGRDGTPGTHGARGADGIPGKNGKDGKDGCKGSPGPRGYPGCDGPPGADGIQGDPGRSGKDGKDGINGTPGPRGQQGNPGIAGVKGDPGPRGEQGIKGNQGTVGLPGDDGLSPTTRAEIDEDGCLVVTTTLGGTVISQKKICCDPALSGCVSITKTCPSGPYTVGDTVNYEICVRNCGQAPLTNVAVVSDASVVGATIGNMGVGEKVILSASSTVTNAQAAAGSFICNASVTGNNGADTVTDSTAHTVPTYVEVSTNPSVRLVKSCDPVGPYDVGDTVNFTFTITNDGDVPLSGVNVTDPNASVSGGPINLAVGASSNAISGTMVVTQAMADAGGFTNTATVSGVGDGTTVTDTDSHAITVTTVRETTTKCAKKKTPLFDETNPAWDFTSNTSGQVEWSSNGITVTASINAVFQNAGTDECRVMRDISGESLTFSVSGLQAYTCDGCAPCLVVCPEIGSLDVGTTFTTDSTYTVKDINDTNQSGNVFSGQGVGNGYVIFELDDIQSNGTFLSGTFGGTQDNTQVCMKRFALYEAVKVTCYADNNEFISAEDCNGNSVAEADIDFS